MTHGAGESGTPSPRQQVLSSRLDRFATRIEAFKNRPTQNARQEATKERILQSIHQKHSRLSARHATLANFHARVMGITQPENTLAGNLSGTTPPAKSRKMTGVGE
jgi:hypothetical protein